MKNHSDIIEELLERGYFLVDILPRQVPPEGEGQYFAVEEYFLKSPRIEEIRRKFTNVLLKLNCYYDLCVVLEEDSTGTVNPPPETLAEWIGSGRGLSVLLNDFTALIALNSGDTYMTVYNADGSLRQLITQLAASEGLFVWEHE